MAERINSLQKQLDPDCYASFFQNEEKHKKKITMQLLTEDGKKEYLNWLKCGQFGNDTTLTEVMADIVEVLENHELTPQKDMEPFVYIEFSEDMELEQGDVFPIDEASRLFGERDYLQKQEKQEGNTLGYLKTQFALLFLLEGELCTYQGRQDFGDGEGSLLQHMEAFQDWYLSTEEGREYLHGLNPEDAKQLKENCQYVKEELIPVLKYFCNLNQIEKAIQEEMQIEKKIPMETEQKLARTHYQKDMLQFILESREALNYDRELPRMPDIRDYEKKQERESYREHVMEEIEAEAKSYGMSVEEYAKNGYEPKIRK